MFQPYLNRWQLIPDGPSIATHSSNLLPVRMVGMANIANVPAMLKISVAGEERNGGLLMEWWNGDGAARVLAREDDAILLERAISNTTLSAMVLHGKDDEASQIMCKVAAYLHAPRQQALPELMPLAHWFQALEPAAAIHGGIFAHSAAAARDLLSRPQNAVVLHGDIHHGNILDFGTRGWLAIDPKGLLGERGFDYANIFCNPDPSTAANPVRFRHQLEVVSTAAALERKRLLQWILAYAGLSAAWSLEDGMEPACALAVAELAKNELSHC